MYTQYSVERIEDLSFEIGIIFILFGVALLQTLLLDSFEDYKKIMN